MENVIYRANALAYSVPLHPPEQTPGFTDAVLYSATRGPWLSPSLKRACLLRSACSGGENLSPVLSVPMAGKLDFFIYSPFSIFIGGVFPLLPALTLAVLDRFVFVQPFTGGSGR